MTILFFFIFFKKTQLYLCFFLKKKPYGRISLDGYNMCMAQEK